MRRPTIHSTRTLDCVPLINLSSIMLDGFRSRRSIPALDSLHYAEIERFGFAKLNTHEEQFVHTFIVPEKRARYLSLLESKRGRDKLLDGLDHCHDLDSRFAKLIPANQQSAQSIERLLKSKGAPDVCHVMSSNPALDNREMPLSEALLETVGMDYGTLISCKYSDRNRLNYAPTWAKSKLSS